MLPIFDGVRDVTVLSTTLRMLLAVVCGFHMVQGLISPAADAFRTMSVSRGIEAIPGVGDAGSSATELVLGSAMLIKNGMGAAMTTLPSQFLYLNLHYYTDMARLGAQVVAGIGFIGAGAIIVTRRRRVKGLTTAAGLWAAAIVGLCLGGGFYEGGIFATALILAAEMFLSKLEYRMLDNAPEVNLYMEYSNKTCLDNVLRLFRDLNLKVLNMEITRSTETETHNACALFTLRLNKRCRVEQLIPKMNATEGVVSVEEL